MPHSSADIGRSNIMSSSENPSISIDKDSVVPSDTKPDILSEGAQNVLNNSPLTVDAASRDIAPVQAESITNDVDSGMIGAGTCDIAPVSEGNKVPENDVSDAQESSSLILNTDSSQQPVKPDTMELVKSELIGNTNVAPTVIDDTSAESMPEKAARIKNWSRWTVLK